MTAADTDHRAPTLTSADGPLSLVEARELIRSSALFDRPVGPVGIELEGHVVPRHRASDTVSLAVLRQILTDWPCLPQGGRLSLEPGGQLEISSRCSPDVESAISDLRADVAVVRAWLGEHGLGWVLLGADPLRPPRQLNPALRYRAMRDWFSADRPAGSWFHGVTMMCSTAALQVNLEAGRRAEWPARVDRAQRLAPVLTALTASSAFLVGRDTGWHSARQRAWSGLDPLTSGQLSSAGDPAGAWVERALASPVMLLPRDGDVAAADRRRTLLSWVTAPGPWPVPTRRDVQRHLTTIFPPVRPRGWLELRAMDSLPDRWWPVVVTAVVAWLDRPELTANVDAVLEGVQRRLDVAARLGIGDPQLRRAVTTLIGIAEPAVPTALRADLHTLLDLVSAGQTPGSLIADDFRRRGPAVVMKELADA